VLDALKQRLQDEARAVPILDIRRCHQNPQHQASVSTTTCRLRPVTFLPAS